MAKANLSRMNVESLMDLRDQVDQRLRHHSDKLQEQLEKIASLGGERVARSARPGGSTLRGRKVAPKYRSPSGKTWAGRGVRPRWIVAAIKEGKKLDDFLITNLLEKGGKSASRSVSTRVRDWLPISDGCAL